MFKGTCHQLPCVRRNKLALKKDEEEDLKVELLAMKTSFLFFMYIFTSKHFDCTSMDH